MNAEQESAGSAPPEPIAPEVRGYLDDLVPARPAELARMEEHAREVGFPIVGPASGQLCYQISRMIGARSVFELGSGFGYFTAWFARAVQENGGGTVQHVVWDEQLSARARRHLSALGDDGIVRYHVGEVVAALREADGPYDVIRRRAHAGSAPGWAPCATRGAPPPHAAAAPARQRGRRRRRHPGPGR